MKFSLLFIVFAVKTAHAQTIKFAYDANGNCTSKTIVGNVPKVLTTGDTVACKGGMVVLTATGAGNHQWSNGSVANSISVTADTTQTYTVVGQNTDGCSDTARHLLRVIPKPGPPVISGDAAAFVGETDTFSVPLNTGSFYNWWVSNGSFITGNGTHVVVIKWNTTPGVGSISVAEMVNNQKCTGDTATKQVAITENPSLIKKTALAGKLDVYPNPADKGVWVDLNIPEPEEYILHVLDAQGREVYRHPLGRDKNFHHYIEENTFRVGGNYIVRLVSQTHIFTHKLTIVKD